MHLPLLIHQDYVCPVVTGITVDIRRAALGTIDLRFRVFGAIADIDLPKPQRAIRGDKLWEHSCFEIFIRSPMGGIYYEYNFAPSMRWAIYRFESYRRGMAVANELTPPAVAVAADADYYELQAKIDAGSWPDLPIDVVWRIGLSAVIEERNGRKSYWALAHPDTQADFHHDVCFAADLLIGES